jgi:hypothetical protein
MSARIGPVSACLEVKQLPHLKSSEVAALVTTIRIRVLALFTFGQHESICLGGTSHFEWGSW